MRSDRREGDRKGAGEGRALEAVGMRGKKETSLWQASQAAVNHARAQRENRGRFVGRGHAPALGGLVGGGVVVKVARDMDLVQAHG